MMINGTGMINNQEPLPVGSRIALVLGFGGSDARGRRVILGRVAGYAVRGGRFVDLALIGVKTWLYGHAITEVDAPDPARTFFFRVQVRTDVRHTLEILRDSARNGRSVLPAVEVYQHTCDRCSATSSRPYPYCGHCGHRVNLGPLHARPAAPPPPNKVACPACWRDLPAITRYCVHCGHDHEIQELLPRIEGLQVRFQLIEQRRRRGTFEGKVVRASYCRVSNAGSPMLILGVTGILAPGRPDLELPPAFRTWLLVHAMDGDARSTIGRILTGESVRATEAFVACPRCSVTKKRMARVHSAYCPECGERCRILTRRPRSRKRAFGAVRGFCESCGHAVGREHHYCGECGASLSSAFEKGQAGYRRGSWSEIARQDVFTSLETGAPPGDFAGVIGRRRRRISS